MGIVEDVCLLICDNNNCNIEEQIVGLTKEEIIEDIEEGMVEWLISGDKTYCCPACQKEAGGE